MAAFTASGLRVGEEIRPALRGSNTEFGGFLAGAERYGFDLVPLVAVWATPAGLVTTEAIETLIGLLVSGLEAALAEGQLAGVLLALHGAMVTEADHDGDALVLEAARRTVGPDVPIVATLDLHANVSQRMVNAANLLIGYHTYPHVDMAERGEDACRLLTHLIAGNIRPTSALRKPPMLPTSQRMVTDRVPMRELIDHARALETDARVVNVTITGGFPPADVPEAGFSVLVTTDGDPDLAAELAETLAHEAWERRQGFLGGVTSWADATALIRDLEQGKLPGTGPLVLVDIADNPWTGGPGDSAELVRFLLANNVADAAVALVKDPATVTQARNVPPGTTFDVLLGGKTDALHGDSLPVRARVRLISDGRYVNEGPMMSGVTVDLGPTALLECTTPDGSAPPVAVLVTTRAETPIDLNIFRAHGIDPTRRAVLGLKGKGHFRASFEPISRRIVLVEGPGITGADLSRLNFQHVRRPIWPLDPDTAYP